MIVRTTDATASRLIADARDGLARYRALTGDRLTGPVLDLGAHQGAYALEAVAAGASIVVAIEAALTNYRALLDNVVANAALGDVLPLYAAAAETDAPTVALRYARGGNSGQHSLAYHAGHPISDPAVPVVRVGRLLTAWAWTLVKIDLEGGEWPWLAEKRMRDLLVAATDVIDLEVHPLDDTAAGYYGPASAERPFAFVDEVGEWFRALGCRVTWSAQHPSRLFIVTKGTPPWRPTPT